MEYPPIKPGWTILEAPGVAEKKQRCFGIRKHQTTQRFLLILDDFKMGLLVLDVFKHDMIFC